MVATVLDFGNHGLRDLPIAGKTVETLADTFQQRFLDRLQSYSTSGPVPPVTLTTRTATAVAPDARWLDRFEQRIHSASHSFGSTPAHARENASIPVEKSVWRNGKHIRMHRGPQATRPASAISGWLERFTQRVNNAALPTAVCVASGRAGTCVTRDQDWILQPSDWSRANRPDPGNYDDDQLLHHARQLQRWARAPGTRKNYLHWWRVFAEFCEKRGWVRSAAFIPLPVPVTGILRWVA
eukprot:COSAG01_NODE_25761_length_734_cov_0.870866_1_plen_239_part_10